MSGEDGLRALLAEVMGSGNCRLPVFPGSLADRIAAALAAAAPADEAEQRDEINPMWTCDRGHQNARIASVCWTCGSTAPAHPVPAAPADEVEVVAGPPSAEWDAAAAASLDANYCPQCDYDQHLCPGCGASVEHGTIACAECNPGPNAPQ